MKITKCIAVIISIVITVLSFPAINASAQGISYSASDVSGKMNDTITVTVKISSSSKIWGSNVSLSYNPQELQYISCEKGDAAANGSLHNTGTAVNFSGTYNNLNGTVFKVKFKILKASGTCTLKLESTENIDYNGKEYDCTTKNGSVTVLGATDVLGDATGDGKVSASDARMILQAVAGVKKLNDKQTLLADINMDGKVSATDARFVLQTVAGLK
jgi:hypothetical protein